MKKKAEQAKKWVTGKLVNKWTMAAAFVVGVGIGERDYFNRGLAQGPYEDVVAVMKSAANASQKTESAAGNVTEMINGLTPADP